MKGIICYCEWKALERRWPTKKSVKKKKSKGGGQIDDKPWSLDSAMPEVSLPPGSSVRQVNAFHSVSLTPQESFC